MMYHCSFALLSIQTDLYIRAVAVDKTGANVGLDYEYDEMWSVEHLLLEARLCAFLEKAFKRGETLHQLHFKCDFLGERAGDAVIGVYFWREQLAELNLNGGSEEVREELVTTSATIVDMYGLAGITVLDENPMLGKERPTRTTTRVTTTVTWETGPSSSSTTIPTLQPGTEEPGARGTKTTTGILWVTLLLLQLILVR